VIRFFVVLMLFLPLLAEASSFYIRPEVQMQVLEDSLSDREVPLNALLDTGLGDLPNNGTFDVSLFDNRTFKIGENSFDLYQAVFKMKEIGGYVNFSAGRQFITPGFHVYLMDGVDMSIGGADWPLRIGLLGGVPRYLEISDFHGTVGLITGAYLELQGFRNHHAKLSAIYQRLDFDAKREWGANSTLLAGLSDTYRFEVPWRPTIYGNVEYDTGGRSIDTGMGGIRVQPTRRFMFNVEGGTYNTNRKWQMPTVYSLFTSGAYYQARGGISYTFIDMGDVFEDLTLKADYSFQRYHIQTPLTTSANLADAILCMDITPIRLDATIGYTFYDSYGGKAHDVIATLHDEPFDKFYIDLGVNYTRYSKITNVKDNAYDVSLIAGYEILKDLVLSAGGEYLRNNVFSSEFRATALLSYNFQGKI